MTLDPDIDCSRSKTAHIDKKLDRVIISVPALHAHRGNVDEAFAGSIAPVPAATAASSGFWASRSRTG